jgi:LPXTG-motif cell wall-anchored protein
MTAQNGAEATPHDLPQTASPLPLILLVGLVALAGIAILRGMTSRKA